MPLHDTLFVILHSEKQKKTSSLTSTTPKQYQQYGRLAKIAQVSVQAELENGFSSRFATDLQTGTITSHMVSVYSPQTQQSAAIVQSQSDQHPLGTLQHLSTDILITERPPGMGTSSRDPCGSSNRLPELRINVEDRPSCCDTVCLQEEMVLEQHLPKSSGLATPAEVLDRRSLFPDLPR